MNRKLFTIVSSLIFAVSAFAVTVSTDKVKIVDVLQKARSADEAIDAYVRLLGKKANLSEALRYFGLDQNSYKNYKAVPLSADVKDGQVVVDTGLRSSETRDSLKYYFFDSIQPFWSLKTESGGRLKVLYPLTAKAAANAGLGSVARGFGFHVGDTVDARTHNYWFSSANWANYYTLAHWTGSGWESVSDDPYTYFAPDLGIVPNRTVNLIKSYWVKTPVNVTTMEAPIKCQNGATYNPLKQRCEAYTSNACPSEAIYVPAIDKCRKYYYASKLSRSTSYTRTVFDRWEYVNKQKRTYDSYVGRARLTTKREWHYTTISYVQKTICDGGSPKRTLTPVYKTVTRCEMFSPRYVPAQCEVQYRSTGIYCCRNGEILGSCAHRDSSKCPSGGFCAVGLPGFYVCQEKVGTRCTSAYYTCNDAFGFPPNSYGCPRNDPSRGICYRSTMRTELVGYNYDYTCPTGYWVSQTKNSCCRTKWVESCPKGSPIPGTSQCVYSTTTTVYTCPSGSFLKGSDCYRKITEYYCPSGYFDNGWNCKKAVYKTVREYRTEYYCPSGYFDNGWNCKKTVYFSPSCYGKKMPVAPYYSTPYYGHNGVCYSDAGLYCKTHGVSWDGKYTCFDSKYYCLNAGTWYWAKYSGKNYRVSAGYRLDLPKGRCIKEVYYCPSSKGHLYGWREHPVYSNASALMSWMGTGVDDRMNGVVASLVAHDVVRASEKGALCAKIGYKKFNQPSNAQSYNINKISVKGF